MATELPPQSEYPDVLYRVTSSSTFCLSSKPYDLPSPARTSDGPQLDLAVEFRNRSKFEVAVRCHLTAARTLPDGGDFCSPFISTTTSFRYAISVAKIHKQRRARDITITVVDCRSLKSSKPVWNAFSVADLFGLTAGNGTKDFKNEYIIFDGLEGTSSNSVAHQYSNIESQLEVLMPALRSILEDTKKRRFSNLLDDVPPVPSLPTAQDADAAYELAQCIAPPQARLSVMTSLLLLQHQASFMVSDMHLAVVMCVSSKVSFSDSELLAHFAEITSAKIDSKQISIRDFLGQQFAPTHGSTTPETRDLSTCMLMLGRYLHNRQEQELKQRLEGLSATALIVSACLKPNGIADCIVTHCDRGLYNHEFTSEIGARDLSSVFLDLRQAVQEAASSISCISPLLKIYTYLNRASGEAKRVARKTEYNEVAYWIPVLRKAVHTIEVQPQTSPPVPQKKIPDKPATSDPRLAKKLRETPGTVGDLNVGGDPRKKLIPKSVQKSVQKSGSRGAPAACETVPEPTTEHVVWTSESLKETEALCVSGA